MARVAEDSSLGLKSHGAQRSRCAAHPLLSLRPYGEGVMTKRSALAVWALASIAAIGSCDRGTTSNRATTAKQEDGVTEPAAKLRAVFQYLHQMNESEIRSGNLAADRTEVPDVKKFATRMATEHATADQKLVDLMRREHLDTSWAPP